MRVIKCYNCFKIIGEVNAGVIITGGVVQLKCKCCGQFNHLGSNEKGLFISRPTIKVHVIKG